MSTCHQGMKLVVGIQEDKNHFTHALKSYEFTKYGWLTLYGEGTERSGNVSQKREHYPAKDE
jgi:hypothetical protein